MLFFLNVENVTVATVFVVAKSDNKKRPVGLLLICHMLISFNNETAGCLNPVNQLRHNGICLLLSQTEINPLNKRVFSFSPTTQFAGGPCDP